MRGFSGFWWGVMVLWCKYKVQGDESPLKGVSFLRFLYEG